MGQQDTLGMGRASDVDHSCEHTVHSMTSCYAMQVENNCHSLGCAGFQMPQLTVFGKIGCQSALYLRESFRLEGTANVIGTDKPASYV